MDHSTRSSVTRRHVLTGAAAVVAASALPRIPARAQASATYTRYNVASPQGQQMLGYYQTAIRAMLQLPPSDPRNWYRLAFTHYLDCPHGNWWLFPWHRGFTGWAEQIVRQYSGYAQFAFPYWDWTASPQVPAAMSQGLLNPANPAFIGDLASFTSAFKPALASSDYWQQGSAQSQQLQYRCIQSNDVLWDQITNPANPNFPVFFPAQAPPNSYPNVRNPDPNLDCVAGKAVSAPMLAAAMAAQDYMTFSSPEAPIHSAVIGFAILEGQPHNKVHNNTGGIVDTSPSGQCGVSSQNIGGFMQAFLSPVDPLFYLHHSNIDRLWDAWTRQQIADRNPYLPPQGPVYDQWAQEPFLFFVDTNGNPVSQTQAGDYASIGAFSYNYQPGGSVGAARPAALQATRARARARPPVRRFAGEAPVAPPGGALLSTGSVGATAVRLQPTLLQLTRPGSPQRLLAKVTLALPHHRRGQTFRVLVHSGNPARSAEVGTVSLFGHSMGHGLLTFTLPLDEAVAALRGRNALVAGGFLHFRAEGPAMAAHHGHAAAAATAVREVRVHSALVEAH